MCITAISTAAAMYCYTLLFESRISKNVERYCIIVIFHHDYLRTVYVLSTLYFICFTHI